MKLLTKLNLFCTASVLVLTLPIVLAGALAIDDIVYGLNRQVLNLELRNVLWQIEEQHAILESHGLAETEAYVRNAQKKLGESLKESRFGQTGRLHIVRGKEGDGSFHEVRNEGLLSREALRRMLARGKGEIEYVAGGSTRFCVYETFGKWNWLVAISLDKAEMFRKRRTFLFHVSVAAVVIMAAVLLARHRFSLALARRIQQTLSYVKAVEAGALPASPLPAGPNDEIGTLQRGVNSMAATIEARSRELARHRDDLEDLVAERTAELKTSQGKLNAMLESIREHMSMMDGQLNIVWANETAKELFGRDIVGKKCYEAFHRRKRPCEPQPCLTIQAFQDGRPHEHDTEVIDARGAERHFHCTANVALRGEDGQPAAVLEISRDVTDRKHAEQRLRELASRQEAILASVPDIIMETDTHKAYTWANRAGLEFFGNDVVGKEAAHYFVGPQDTYEKVQQLFEGDECVQYVESWQRRRDGEARLLAWWCRVLKDADGNVTGALSTARDITDGRRAQEALLRSERNYRTVIENLPQRIFLKDRDSVYVSCNRSYARDLGVRPEDVAGKTDYDFHPRELADKYRADDRRVMASRVTYETEEAYVRDGQELVVHTAKVAIADEQGNVVGLLGIFWDITERKRAEESLKRLATAIDQCEEAVMITDAEGFITYVNPAFERITGYTRAEAIGQNPRLLKSGKQEESVYRQMWQAITSGQTWSGHFVNRRKDGALYEQRSTITPIRDEAGEIISFVAILGDVTQDLSAERRLRQAQKLESIGRLAAGIAHEINTPMQYVGDNTRFLGDNFDDLLKLLKQYQRLRQAGESGPVEPRTLEELDRAVEELDVAYLTEEIPRAIRQSLEGIARVNRIVHAMREFSQPGVESKTPVDLNSAIETIITVSRNEWKYVAEMETDLDPDFPLVQCLPGEINQVILNLIVNAAQAIADVVGEDSQEKGRIRITTRRDGEYVEIRVADTGTGIPEEITKNIFDPFFTTKREGQGTGQGLAIAHSVVVDKHGGTIDFETELGKGSVFIIRLPLPDTHEPPEGPWERSSDVEPAASTVWRR